MPRRHRREDSTEASCVHFLVVMKKQLTEGSFDSQFEGIFHYDKESMVAGSQGSQSYSMYSGEAER